MIEPAQAGAWIVAAVCGGAAAFERLNNIRVRRKHEQNAEAISDARKHQERAEVMGKLADDYKALFEREHAELTKYRNEVHEKARKDVDLMMKKDERIMELQARPDFTDLFAHLEAQADHMRAQSDVSVRILAGMEKMLDSIKLLVERTAPLCATR